MENLGSHFFPVPYDLSLLYLFLFLEAGFLSARSLTV